MENTFVKSVTRNKKKMKTKIELDLDYLLYLVVAIWLSLVVGFILGMLAVRM